ncbi:hypothetical protein CLOM_g10093, partial [Closterium sp. NIES-68]
LRNNNNNNNFFSNSNNVNNYFNKSHNSFSNNFNTNNSNSHSDLCNSVAGERRSRLSMEAVEVGEVGEVVGKEAAFSKAIQAHDLHTGMDVCLKISKNNKDIFDQSLDEIKLLKFINRHDPADEHHLLRMYDYFYHREHLFIICELLRANLYEFCKYNWESGGEDPSTPSCYAKLKIPITPTADGRRRLS